MEEAPRFLRRTGTGCLLLPSKILQNQTDVFQSRWLRRVTLEEVIQLADYSFLLFRGALCPAIIAKFKNEIPELSGQMIEFSAPKFSRDGLRQGIITISPPMRSRLSLADILSAAKSKTAPIVWKRHLWGTPRDQKLLDLLLSLPPLRDHVDVLSELRRGRSERSRRWITGQGLKPWPANKDISESDRALKENKWPADMSFVEADPWSSDLFLLPADTISFGERLRKKQYHTDLLYSRPPAGLFEAPMVLVSQGFDKVAFSDFGVLFQDSLQSITGPEEDTDLLMFLTAYLRSNLARYFLFHTAANWGTERDKVHLNELLRVPFPLPGNESNSSHSPDIVREVGRMMTRFRNELQAMRNMAKTDSDGSEWFGHEETDTVIRFDQERKRRTSALQEEIESSIYRYFDLTEQEIILIHDTISVFERSSTPTNRWSKQTVTLDPTERTKIEPYAKHGLQAYASTLTATLNKWAQTEKSGYRVRAEGGTDNSTGLAMVVLSISNSEAMYRPKSLSHELMDILKAFREHSFRRCGSLSFERDTILFQGEQIYIVRPNILFNWTRTEALNDAARIYGDIALGRKES